MTHAAPALATPLCDTGTLDLAPGDLVGSFVIIRALGAGGSADVYEAEHLHLGRRRALKVVRHQEDGGDETLERFRRETKVAGMVRHPHVADVFDTGLTDGGEPYLVMELLDGETLDVCIERGALPAAAAVEVSRQLLDALSHVHAQGIVHRDVKPANIILHRAESGRIVVKLIDFGICRRVGHESRREIVGTPQYMAPELFEGAAPSPAHDVYAAGIVLFECLTGRPPYDGKATTDAVQAVLRGAVPDLRRERPTCAEVLVEVVTRAIARRPGERFQHASELRAALDDVADTLHLPRGSEALSAETPSCACEITHDGAVSWSEPDGPLSLPVRRARSWHAVGITISAIGLLLASLGGLGVYVLGGDAMIAGAALVAPPPGTLRADLRARADRTAALVVTGARSVRSATEAGAREE